MLRTNEGKLVVPWKKIRLIKYNYNRLRLRNNGAPCPRSSDPFYRVIYYIKWGTTSWTDGIYHPIFPLRHSLGSLGPLKLLLLYSPWKDYD